MTSAKKAFEFQKQLAPMVAEEILTASAADVIVQTVGDLFQDYASELADLVEQRYREWELTMDENDHTLYTLGLRHAKDIILYGKINDEI